MTVSPDLPAPLSRRSILQMLGLAGGLAVAGPTLAACGSGSSPTSGGGTPKAGGSIVIGVPKPILTMDPYRQNVSGALSYLPFYDYLIEYGDNFKPIPRIAESWTISSDNTSITVKLRAAKFHSGNPVTADDIVAGVKRQMDPKKGAALASMGGRIASVTKVDDSQVTVTFKQAHAENTFLDWMFDFPVIEGAHNDADSLVSKIYGSGPFKLASYDPNSSLKLAKNTDYWDSGKPLLDNVEIRFFTSTTALKSAMQAGSLDIAADTDTATLTALKSGFNTTTSYPVKLSGLVFNTSMAPFDNVKVRQAVSRALNRDKIIQLAWGGYGQPIYSLFAPTSAGFDKSYMDKLGYDLNAAKALLDESGVTNLKGTATFQASNPTLLQMFEILQADLKTIGFDLELKTLDTTAWSDLDDAGKLALTTNTIDTILNDPGNITDPRFATVENVWWAGGKAPQEWVDAVAQVQAATSPSELTAAYAAMNQALYDTTWVIGVTTYTYGFVAKKSIQGFTVNQRVFPNLRDTSTSA